MLSYFKDMPLERNGCESNLNFSIRRFTCERSVITKNRLLAFYQSLTEKATCQRSLKCPRDGVIKTPDQRRLCEHQVRMLCWIFRRGNWRKMTSKGMKLRLVFCRNDIKRIELLGFIVRRDKFAFLFIVCHPGGALIGEGRCQGFRRCQGR